LKERRKQSAAARPERVRKEEAGHSDTKELYRKGTATAGLSVLDILDAVPFYVLLVDEDHYILEANAAVYDHLGISREQVLGKYCPMIIHGISQPFQGCPLEDAVKKNASVEKELLDEKSGRWVMSAVYPTRALTSGGKRIFLHLVTDITDRKVAQDQLRTSHEQMRRLSAHLETVREEEKRKISRDLHDETSQVLSSLHAYLEAAIQTLPAEAEQSREILRKAQNLSTTILDEIRKLIYELRPSMLDGLGLAVAVKSLANNHLKPTGLKVRVLVSGNRKRTTPELETILFRVVQEAFNNILKHANSRNVEVRLSFRKSSITVNIRDDGIGFDFQDSLRLKDKQLGMGLIGMRERISLVNGSLEVRSKPGKGTEISVEVPRPAEEISG
jgi:PAS domain S-box-containing protein